jgi:predicted dehydrogenase
MSKPRKSRSAVRLAIIGTGGMAAQHARMFGEIRGCKLVAACDVDAERARTFASTHGIARTFTSVDELLLAPGIDAVSIVTPDAFHAPIALQCLAAGKHVLCEKPLALNHADAKRMPPIFDEEPQMVVVHFVYLFGIQWITVSK